MTSAVRVALAQLCPVSGDVSANFALARQAIAQAAAESAVLVVFPELFLSGYAAEPHPDLVIGAGDDRLAALAEPECHVAAVLGLREASGRKLPFNSAFYVQDGTVCHVQRKASLVSYHLFAEDRIFTPGPAVRAFDTTWGRMGILIRNDAWHPALAAVLAHDGAHVLVIPAASADLTLPDLSGIRRTWRAITSLYACLFQCYVIFVNLVGTDHGWVFAGGSHVVGPHGEVIAEAARDREELLVADLDLGSVLECRRTTPLSRNPRLDLVHRETGRLLGPGVQRLKDPGVV